MLFDASLDGAVGYSEDAIHKIRECVELGGVLHPFSFYTVVARGNISEILTFRVCPVLHEVRLV